MRAFLPGGIVVAALTLPITALLACKGKKVDSAPAAPSVVASTSTSASTSASVVVSASASASVDPLTLVPYRALVAAEAWEYAARAIDLLPPIEREKSPARLARLRVAVGRCTKDEGNLALGELEVLRRDPDTAVISDVLAHLEIDALVCAERYADALAMKGPHALTARPGAIAARHLARVLEASGDLTGARAALTKAIDNGQSVGLPIGKLIAARLRLARAQNDQKAIELDRKRLFLEYPRAFDEAVKAGESNVAPPMTAENWFQRADAIAGEGRGDDALHAIDAAASAGAPARRVAHARGWALYRAKSYARAAIALAAAAKMGNDEGSIDDSFHAARATSRSGDDASAIVAYDKLAKAHPSTNQGAEAAYLAAHLRYLHGQWKEAIEAFDKYLAGPWAKNAKQELNVREAKRARTLALLEVGRAHEAKRALHTLAIEEYPTDGYARSRIEILEAIASERLGDKAAALRVHEHHLLMQPYGYLDLAARLRIPRLGGTAPTWPAGPIAPASPPALTPRAILLHTAGLQPQALDAVLTTPSKVDGDAARCALFGALDAGNDAYRLGLKLPVSTPPDAATAWSWRCAYPTPYDDVVASLEKREGLPRGLVHSVLRQESAFRIDVVSPAGAVGIAQLMPATALMTAQSFGKELDPTDVAALKAPFLQLDLAARHLHALYVELAGENASDERKMQATTLVVAAYNAGAGAVKRWLGEAGRLDADVFIERIPFIETRGYTARVLGNLVHYAIIAGAPTPTLPARFDAFLPAAK